MTPTTVEMLAARPKEQRCLEVLAWAKWSSGRARIFTTASGSLVAPSCSTHTRTVSTLSASPMTSWHLTSQACESQCATEQPKRFCCNGSAFASRSWKQGAGKAVTRCEENGFDKKFVQKVLNKIITKQPLPRTTGWSEGDSAKPQSFQCKQNGFRSQKIQHSPLCFVVWRLTVTWGYNICWIRMLGICRDTASCSGDTYHGQVMESDNDVLRQSSGTWVEVHCFTASLQYEQIWSLCHLMLHFISYVFSLAPIVDYSSIPVPRPVLWRWPGIVPKYKVWNDVGQQKFIFQFILCFVPQLVASEAKRKPGSCGCLEIHMVSQMICRGKKGKITPA